MTETPRPEQSPPGRRWLRRSLIALALFVLLLVLAAVGGFHWLTRTESGAGFALGQARNALAGLDWSSAEGNLRDGLILEGLRFDQDGLSIDARRSELAVRVRLFGGILITVDRLRIDGADITLPPPDPDETPAPFSIPDLASPVPIEIEEVHLTNLRVLPAAGEAPVAEVNELRLSGRMDQALALTELALRMPEGELRAVGELGLDAPHRIDLDLEARTTLEAWPEHRAEVAIRGPLRDLDIALETMGPARLTGPIRLRGLPDLERVSVELDGQFADWPGIDYAARDLSIALEGAPHDWRLQLGARAEGPELPDNRIQVDATGSLSEARLETLRIQTLNGQITAQGRAGWSPDVAAELSMTIDQLDLTTRYPELPAQARLDGNLSLTLQDSTLLLESLALRAPPTTLSVLGNGRYDPANDDLALDLIWQDFTWPPVIDDAEPVVASERGEIQLSGRLSDWRAELDALLQVPDQPDADVRASIQGDRSGALIEALRFDAAEAGLARLNGELRWDPEVRGRMSAELTGLDPAEFVRQLPGRVSARIDVELEGPDRFTFDLQQLEGTLRGQDLSGGGRIRWQAQAPEAGQLEIALGDNRLAVDSSDGERWAFRAQGPALDQLWPGLSGVLEAEGEVMPASAEARARATIRDGGLDDITLSELDLSADLRWREPTRADVLLTLKNLDFNPWERIHQLELTLDGRCRDHRFGLNFDAQRANLDLAGRGQWLDCLRGGELWEASVDTLSIGDTVAGQWQLDRALSLSARPELVAIEPACLEATESDSGTVCLDEARLAPGGRASSALVTLDQVPADLLLLPLDPTVSVSSRLSGSLDAGWTVGVGLDRLGGSLAMSAGAVTALGADQPLLRVDGLRLNLTPDNGGVLAELDGRFEGQSRLIGAIGIEDLRAPEQSTVNGTLGLDLPDISVFNRAIPELDEIHGRLEGEMDVRGRLDAPQLEGQARLVNGAVVHAPLGVDLQDIQLAITGNNLQAELTGQLKSGEGQLQLDGDLRPGERFWRWRLNTSGESFRLTNTDWLELTVSPQLRLSGEGRQMEIDGDIAIDRLKAGLPPGRAARIDASDDVIVLGETDPEAQPAALTMTGRLGIDLGGDARLAAAGLETRLAGQVELLWDESGTLPRSRGIIRLPEGSYQAYGQNLEIEGGEIVLSNQPVTNPRLDIEAVREIFGDPQVERAGVSIRGSAQTPEIQLFTDPPTSEEKALAYVLTGADFDHAGGQGAVNVGLYLLPKLFVSYGIGLFESGNVLSGRYELSRHWGVRVVSGERDTGVDLSYAVDR